MASMNLAFVTSGRAIGLTRPESFCGRCPRVATATPRVPAPRRVCISMKQEGATPRWVYGLGFTLVITALASPSFLPLLDSPSGMSDIEIDRRLKQVPLFSVTDPSGKPFLNEVNNRREGYFFFDPDEAEGYLAKVREVAAEGGDARILAVSLNDAYKFVRGKAGGDDVYKLRANKAELDQAKKAIGGEFFGTVPLFFVDGVAFLNGDETVVPLFFDKEDLDATIEKLTSQNPDLAAKIPETCSVIDLGSAMDELKSGKNKVLKNVVLFPSEKAVDYYSALRARDP